MELDAVLVRSGICESYVEARELIFGSRVKVNNRVEERPWRHLRGGYYAIIVKGYGLFRFNIRAKKVGKVKAKYFNWEAKVDGSRLL